MTKNELLSCVIGVIILSLLVGAYFYQKEHFSEPEKPVNTLYIM